MSYEVKEMKRCSLIVVHEDRLIAANSTEFGEVMEAQIQKGQKNIILNLSEVNFFASAAIREIITVLKHARERGGDLVLCEPSAKVLEVLDIVGLPFTIYDSCVDATGSF